MPRNPELKSVKDIMFSVHWQDEEDQAYLMDDAGNFEPSQIANPVPLHREEPPGAWGDEQDDQDYLAGLTDFEQNSGEISDQILLTCVTDLDSQ